MSRSTTLITRLLETSTAIVVWAALAVQLVLMIGYAHRHGLDTLQGLLRYFGFFTVLTNLLVALVLTVPRMAPRSVTGRVLARNDVATMAAASILLVAIAYFLLLRHVWHPHGWQLAADVGLHYVVPTLFTLHWWLAVPKRNLHWHQISLWSLYPIGYFVLTLLRGAITHVYPYYFIDAGRLGYGAVMLNALAILAGFLALSALLIRIGRLQSVRD